VRRGLVAAAGVVIALAAPTTVYAAFPYGPPATSGSADYHLPDSEPRPNEILAAGAKQEWMYSATAGTDNAAFAADPRELNGVRGAHIVDKADPPSTAWETTTGRTEVTIATLDSGIKWNDAGAMQDLRRKTRINEGEAPKPLRDRGTATEEGQKPCAQFADAYDANGDGVFNVIDYACDSRVALDSPKGVGPSGMLEPQDVLIAFSDGNDDDGNGYVDDLVGWDFLDDDNDPYDDVQYGHGTGEARDSAGEAGNDGDIGACPNCMVIHMRVGDSFIADVNRFAQAVTYAVDNDVLVVQEALGTLNNSTLGTQAVEYAYDHGVTVIASAADEAAQHNNWPSSNPHVILVNSVTKYATVPDVEPETILPGSSPSYLSFNGCTNFNSKITLAIPSVSCSSDATGRASGMAGLIYSAAINASKKDKLDPHPSCKRVGGDSCLLSANEVRQLMASGKVDAVQQSDDVNFTQGAELVCPAPGCTDPFSGAGALARAPGAPAGTSKSYPAREGHDQFYGYGRVNMDRAVKRTADAVIPPEGEIESPDWYDLVDANKGTLDVRGSVGARGRDYSCRVYVAPGSYPHNGEAPGGDFKEVSGASHCDGGQRSDDGFNGVLATVHVNELKSRYPAATSFTGPQPPPTLATHNGRPNVDPNGFVVKVVVSTSDEGRTLTGEDRRNMRLHRDPDLLEGFPRDLGGDGASSPLFVDLDEDNRNELVIGGSDGFVHAYKRDGSEAPGWPVRGDKPPLHTGSAAWQSGEVSDNFGGAILASVAAGDLDHDGSPEVVAADLEGKVYAWSAGGNRVLTKESKVEFSGKPLAPFENVRQGRRHRTQHGFIGSPVLADLDRNDGGRLEIVAAAMDRHVYAWNDDGSSVPGFPVLLVDRDKITGVDPTTHALTFKSEEDIGKVLDQGAIVDTPAVADIAGDDRPEIVVGTNEEYFHDKDGGVNSQIPNGFTLQILGTGLGGGNSRLYAIKPEGDSDGDAMTDDFKPAGSWPFKVGLLQTQVLPVVGEGVTPAPIIGSFDCGGDGPKIGVAPDAGPAYVLKPDGTSCLGKHEGKDVPLASDFAASGTKYDTPTVPAFGQPAFATLDAASDTSFVMPALGLNRALDILVQEYQNGQDFMGVWNPGAGGQFHPGFPAPVNDLQFLTGPSVADLEPGVPGEEIVAGTASLDLQGFSAAGTSMDPQRWPKLTSDWTVANPLIGTWDQLETDSEAKKVVFAVTRAGFMLPFETKADPCSPASWPRFHHDNANSGAFGGTVDRDAVAPGKPMDVALHGNTLSWKAPGDDLLCGRADHYEVVVSDERPTTPRSFRAQKQVEDPPTPGDPGSPQSMGVPPGSKTVSIRAVDDAGNVGPAAAATRGRR
jgi:hypothetical protein